MMGEKEARYMSVKQETMETNRSSIADQSEKYEHELGGHRKRKSMTDHAFDALIMEKRKSIPADKELGRPERLPPEVGNKRHRVRDTVSFSMGKATSICHPEAVSLPASEAERRVSEENCVAFSKRLRENRDPVKKEYCSYDGTDTADLHDTLVTKSWNGASLMEDGAGSNSSENRHLNSCCTEDEANLIDSELEQSKREKEAENKLKKVQWCCENRMSKLLEKQREEIQKLNSIWEQERVALEKNHNRASVRIYSEHRYPVRTIKLEILDKEFDSKMELYKQEKEKSLKKLEEKLLAARNEESQKAADWLRQAKSNANKERVHTELPLHGSQNRNQVGSSVASENGPPARPENIVPEVGAVKKEASIDDVQSINDTSLNGKSSNIVSAHNSENEGETIPCGVSLDIDTAVELGNPVLEFDNRKTDRGGDQIDSNSPNAVKKPNGQANSFIRSNLSTIGEKCGVEASPLKGNDRNNQLNSEQERDSSSILSGKEQLREPQNTRTIESISNSIKKVKKKCDKRMRRLVQKHEEEIQDFNKLWDQKWLILEKTHDEVSAVNNSMQRFSGRIDKLDALNSEFDKMKEAHKHQKEMFLKDLEQTQLAEISEEHRKAAHWITVLKSELQSELESLASEDRANGEPSWVGTIKTETAVANTTSENDSVSISFKEAPVDGLVISNGNGETDSSNLLSGMPREPEKQASDDVCTLSQAEVTAHDTLKDHDALVVLGVENSEKENYGGNLICSKMLSIQDDYNTAEKVKVPYPESSNVAQLEYGNHKDPLVELPKEPQPSLAMNLHATPMNLPPACELVHVPEDVLQTGVIPSDGLAKPIRHNVENMENGLKETVVSCRLSTESETIFPQTPRSPNEEVRENSSANIFATSIEGANSVRSSNCDESPKSCSKKLSCDGKSVEQAEGVLMKQGETAPTEEGVGFEPIERDIEELDESNEKISIGCNTVRKESDGANSIIPDNSPSTGQSLEICSPDQPVVSAICDLPLPHNLETQNKFSRDENGQSCPKLSQQVDVLSPVVQSTVPPVMENQTNLHQAIGLVHETSSRGRINLPRYTDPPLYVAEDRSDISHCGVEQIGRDLERPHPLLVSESPLGPTPENSSSQDAVILPHVVELTVDDTSINSILQSEPNLSCHDYNYYDQISSWILTDLQNESEKISKEKEQVTKNREDLNSRLESECANEIDERIAKIKSKYESNLQDAETNCLLNKKENETMQNKVLANEKLSQAFRSTHLNPSSLTTMRMQQVVNSSFLQLLHQLPPLGLVPKPSSMAASPSALQQIAVRPPGLQVTHQSAGLFSIRPPTRPLTITSIAPVVGSTVVRSNMRGPAPHIRHFQPSAQSFLPATSRPPPPSPPLWSQRPQSIYPKTSPSVASPSSWSALPYMRPHSQHALGNLAGISHSPPLASSWPPPPPPPTPQPPHPLPPSSTDFPSFQSLNCSSQPVSTNQSSLHHRQQPETAGASTSTSTPSFTDLSALRFLVDMDNL